VATQRGRNSENPVDQTPRIERVMRFKNSRFGFGDSHTAVTGGWSAPRCCARLQYFPRPVGLDARRSDGADQSAKAELAAWPKHRRFRGSDAPRRDISKRLCCSYVATSKMIVPPKPRQTSQQEPDDSRPDEQQDALGNAPTQRSR